MGSSDEPEHSASTLVRTIAAGDVVRFGSERGYRRLVAGEGEPRVLRTELLPGPAPDLRRCRSLVHLVQFSDLQIADVQSPARIEFLEALQGLPGGDFYTPVARPQEALAVHGFEAVVRTVNGLGASRESGRPIDLAVSTGDNIDNAQHNELDWYLTLLIGGLVDPDSGGAGYQGVQALDWADPAFWHPDGDADRYRDRWGFPAHPGLLASALRPFRAVGLQLPWLSCYGNHEALVAGTAVPTTDYERVLLGDRKPTALAPGRDAARDEQLFCAQPQRFLDGQSRPVVADPRRRTVSRAEYVRRMSGCPGRPVGHGLDAANVRDGTAYGCHDTDDVRFVMLDTTNLDGESEAMTSGSIGDVQYRWLDARLREAHSRYLDADGLVQRTGAVDRPVVLLSHHSLATITGTGGPPPRGHEPDAERRTRADLLDLLFCFPNVVLWLNGHEHVNRIRPHVDPRGRHPGFWEVTTSAVIDWPCQVRQIEILLTPEGSLAITTTMVDSAAPLVPDVPRGVAGLAALQRELAANDPFRGLAGRSEAHAAGTVRDRNAVLLRSWRRGSVGL